jgi:hypothetical protein
MVTIGIVFLLGILGLVVDAGYGYYLKQVVQASADSAVMAGATAANASGSMCGTSVSCPSEGYTCPDSPTNPPVTNFDSACLYAKANGAPSQQVTLYGGSGSQSGSGISNGSYWMTATVTKTMPLGFLRVMGFQSADISATASSGTFPSSAAGGCIYVLDPNGSNAFNAPGTAGLASNCGIYVNSTSSSAFRTQGNSNISANSIKVVGAASISNNSTVTPTPTTGVSPISDPLANLPAPDYSGCDYTGFQTSASQTVNPGVYCNGMKITGGTITFNAGVYVLRGIGLQVSGNNTVLNGSGVMFYNTGDSSYPAGTLNIPSGVSSNLSGATSGVYQGILFFQDRSSNQPGSIGGGSTQNLTGSIYMPNAALYFSGGSSTQASTAALIVKDIGLVGNSYLALDPTGQYTGISQSAISLTK